MKLLERRLTLYEEKYTGIAEGTAIELGS